MRTQWSANKYTITLEFATAKKAAEHEKAIVALLPSLVVTRENCQVTATIVDGNIGDLYRLGTVLGRCNTLPKVINTGTFRTSL